MNKPAGEGTIGDTEERLRELERLAAGLQASVGRQRLVIGGLAVLLAVVLVGGAVQSVDAGKVGDELRVKRLAIIDDKGKERIVASTKPNSVASVTCCDHGEKIEVAVGAWKEGPVNVVDLDGFVGCMGG